MTERIIEIAEQAAFLNLSNNLLSIRIKDDPPVTVPVGEVQCLILANPAVTVTGALLAALAENGAIVVISGKDRLPMITDKQFGDMVSLYGKRIEEVEKKPEQLLLF